MRVLLLVDEMKGENPPRRDKGLPAGVE